MPELVIDTRFRGPASSGNGGYSCGVMAAAAGAGEVTLRLPPPLERPLSVEGGDVRDGDALVAEARPADVDLAPPRAVTVEEARAAEARYSGDQEHPFPECFVCGPARDPADALVLRPGRVDGEELVATVWKPHESLAENGTVRPEFVWAALDCPGAFAVELIGRGTRVLGRLAVHIHDLPRAGDEYVVVGWPLGGEGRRQDAGTALLAAGGRVLAVGRATWIEPRA